MKRHHDRHRGFVQQCENILARRSTEYPELMLKPDYVGAAAADSGARIPIVRQPILPDAATHFGRIGISTYAIGHGIDVNGQAGKACRKCAVAVGGERGKAGNAAEPSCQPVRPARSLSLLSRPKRDQRRFVVTIEQRTLNLASRHLIKP